MKKIFSFLLLAMLFVAGTCVAQGQKRWRVTDIELTLSTDELDGVQFVMNNGSEGGGSNDFIRGTEKSSTLTDENLFVLEDTQTRSTEDRTVYRLKRVADNTYLENKDGKVAYTETASRAWTFYIMEATQVTEDELNADPATLTDFRDVTTNGIFGNSLIFVDSKQEGAGAKDATYRLCSNGKGVAPSFSKTNYATDFFNLYAVEEALGYAYLEDAITEIFDGAIPTDLYNPGDQPGNISQELYDELTGAYDEAQQLINDMSEDHAACVAAAERCEKAYKAAQEGVVLVKAGYYYFRSARSENSVTYEDGANMRWVEDWTEKDVLTPNDCKYIWELIENPERRGSYFIRNLFSQRYCGYASAIYTLIPTTEEAEESFLIYPLDKDYFVIQSTSLVEKGGASGYKGYDCLHAQVNGHSMVIWQGTEESKTGSGWKFLHVDQAKIDAVQDAIAQVKLNEELKAELVDATTDYKKGFSYTFDGNHSGKLDNEDDGTPKGLVTSLDQISTNAQEASEGPMTNILDSDISSGNFWHSSWSSDNFDHSNNYPYLQFDLKKAVNGVCVKMWARLNGSNYYANNLPGKVHVLATNDPEGEWTEIGYFENQLKWPAVTEVDGVESTASSNTVSLVSLPFGDTAYQYVRMEICTRLGSTTDFKSVAISSACVNMSELRVFESIYDPDNSLIQAVPEDITNALIAAMDKAQSELDAESGTQATLNELKKAHNDFLDNFPDPQLVKDDIASAEAILKYAVEGDDFGYYTEGAKDEFKAALEAVSAQVKEIMTTVEVKALREEVAAAIAAFKKKMNLPADGAYVHIISKTSGKASDAFLMSAGNSAKVNKWQKADDYLFNRPETVWQFIHNADGTYALKNAANGEYLATPREGGSTEVGMTTKGDTCSFTLQTDKSADTEGCLNFIFADDVYLNADPAGTIVTWGEANGKDNSTFQIEAVDVDDAFDGEYAININAAGNTFLTLSISVEADKNCYEVLGRNGNRLELKPISGIIEGGTPFVYVNESDETTTTLVSEKASIADFVWATEAKTVNGLAGTLAPVDSLKEGYGILFEGKNIVDSQLGESVDNNSAYVLPTVPTTTETGEKFIAIDGKIDAIGNAAVSADAAFVNVYTLTGVKVRSAVKAGNATNGLPAGLYIVGSKKVLVK